ncbi:exopolysaccharide biosynthesis polyprenyl glycosylphosphotransferase [Arsenicicoccus piscis]|uniref:exopolysaccharide biosynthesis polyprenyl glycosylphosphotransferase n=1 Tax=Arsenicicoccus piscis TaxID=673954 RepID=UPI001F4CF608|nr:exopolysaccharide biosynthesis polyprenyl glycosylphosphotransferase [Arsenicicoccus piscis]MCH8626484.1 exopolysaccharide biosynthesis polyprenyl glycosylphosphotransferase [Arsenicicoccus piscis]
MSISTRGRRAAARHRAGRRAKGEAPRRSVDLLPAGRHEPDPDRLSWSLFRGVPQLTVASDVLACLLSFLFWRPDWAVGLGTTVCLLLLFGSSKLYRSRLNLSVLEDLPGILGRVIIASAFTGLIVSIARKEGVWSSSTSNHPLTFAATVFLLVMVGRLIAYTLIRWARARRRVGHRTLVLGAGFVGREIAKILMDHPAYGLNPVGYLDADPRVLEVHPTVDTSLPVLGTADSLEEMMIEHHAHVLIVAFSSVKEHQMVDMIRTCDKLDAELFVVPRLYELHHVEGDMDTVWGVPLVRLRRAAHRSWTWRIKRLLDVLLSGFAVLVLSPLMGLLALGCRLDGGPGIIFEQDRVGVDGEPVRVMKFRSMRPVNDAESQTNWNIANDKRLSAWGKFIRKTSLDELPQLFNILRGDMSVVGPRPERPYFVQQFGELYPSYHARHRVPCGLTGWAAVNGLRGDTSIEERARFDNYYIQNWSLWLDAKIILRTVGAVITGAGG